MTNVQPIHQDDFTLEQLREEWQALKNAEQTARDGRIAIENRMLEHPQVASLLKDEGTVSVDGVTIQTGYTRKWDQDRLAALVEEGIPAKLFPFAIEYKEVRAESKYLENNEPDTWAYIAKALELKPKKPYISIREKKQ